MSRDERCYCGDPACVSCGPAQGFAPPYREADEEAAPPLPIACHYCGLAKFDLDHYAGVHGVTEPVCCDLEAWADAEGGLDPLH